jgi:hypothetical protein
MKTESGETILYINKYYEKNMLTDIVASFCVSPSED